MLLFMTHMDVGNADFARAKIAAYSGGASLVRSIFKKKINGPAGTYGFAISHYLDGSAKTGLKLMKRLH